MSLAAAFLLIGASVTAELTGVASPGRVIAERMDAPYKVVAHSGFKLEQVLPLADRDIAEAAMVVCVDCLFWNGTDRVCDHDVSTARRLFQMRGAKPMIVATVPQHAGQCAEVINKELTELCKDACILVRLEGELEPPYLHPEADYIEKVVNKIYAADDRRISSVP